MPSLTDHADTQQHVAFAGALARWIECAGVTNSEAVADLAVGMADVLHAAAQAAQELDALLQLDPRHPAGADAALTRLGKLNALFLFEMSHHLEDLTWRWESLEAPLLVTAPADADGESESPAG